MGMAALAVEEDQDQEGNDSGGAQQEAPTATMGMQGTPGCMQDDGNNTMMATMQDSGDHDGKSSNRWRPRTAAAAAADDDKHQDQDQDQDKEDGNDRGVTGTATMQEMRTAGGEGGMMTGG